jgi:predicted DNA-binding protein
MLKNTESKKLYTLRLAPNMIARIDESARATGLKKTTIIEQGIETRLQQIEKALVN